MTSIQPPDSHHLRAALGWMELGLPAEAVAELDKLSSENQEHFAVLETRWNIRAALQQWPETLALAQRLTAVAPGEPVSWNHLAVSLYRLGRTQEAWDTLHPKMKDFPKSWAIQYDLACYAAQLGRLDDAQQLIDQAMKLGDADEIRRMMMLDPDLMELRPRYKNAE